MTLESEQLNGTALAYKKENDVMDALMDAAPVLFVVLDADGSIIRYNQYTAALVGVPLNEVKGKCWFDVFAPEKTRKAMLAKFIQTSGAAHGHGWVLQVVDSHGNQHDIEWYQSTVRHGDGRIQMIVAVGRSISEPRPSGTQVDRTQKLKAIGQLAAGIAHEINTPTQYIMDNIHFLCDTFGTLHHTFAKFLQLVEHIRNSPPTPELISEMDKVIEDADIDFLLAETPEAIAQTLEGVSRVSRIVQSLKEFAQPGGTGKKIININHAIETTIVVARNEWKDVADMETSLDPDLPEIPASSSGLNEVFLNMIINAAQALESKSAAMPDARGTITISTCQAADDIEIRISDNGVGIASDIQEKIFDPFYTTREVGRGLGQGLSIAHNVITQQHGGTIEVESEFGIGTTFIIRLPLPAHCRDTSIETIRL
jgi:two-component system, NtrC family, sensor kinase